MGPVCATALMHEMMCRGWRVYKKRGDPEPVAKLRFDNGEVWFGIAFEDLLRLDGTVARPIVPPPAAAPELGGPAKLVPPADTLRRRGVYRVKWVGGWREFEIWADEEGDWMYTRGDFDDGDIGYVLDDWWPQLKWVRDLPPRPTL